MECIEVGLRVLIKRYSGGSTLFTYWLLLYVLAIVSTFGFGVALNMIVRRGWFSPVLYILFGVYLLIRTKARLAGPVWVLFLVALAGALMSGFAVRSLRKRGYSIFAR